MFSRGAMRARGLTAATLGFACGLLPGCSSDHAGQSAAAAADPADTRPAIQVQVSEAVPTDEVEAYSSDLYVERDVWVTPRATGIIEQVLVDRGQRVRQGQPLVVLETDLPKVDVQIAEQTLRFREAEYARSKELHEQNIVSAVDALRDEIERDLAASELERARALLERCTVRAPFDGVVVERLAVPGQRVLEEEATRLVRVVADDPIRARVYVPESLLANVATGQPVSIGPGAGASATLAAHVVFVSPVVDAASGTVLVIVEADRRDPALHVGEGVSIRLGETRRAGTALFRVPREALGTGDLVEGSPVRLLVAAGGRATERRADLVELRGTQATVRGGLAPGDLVIVAGGARLAPGDPVEVRSRTP